MIYISFKNEFYLLFLFVIPVIIFFYFYSLKNLKGKAIKFANFEAISRVRGVDLFSRNVSVLILDIVFIVLIIFVLSGMLLNMEMDSSKFSYVIAIDCSESMSANDFLPDRISAAKEAAINFVNILPYDTFIGVVSFSGDTILKKGLSKDKSEIISSLKSIGLCPISGTDINEVVINSESLLRKEKYKALIILSDGQINVGNLTQAIDYSRENNLLVHTIGVGTVDGGETLFGLSKIDENSLKSLSFNTGGKYINAKENLSDTFNELIPVTKKLIAIELKDYLLIALLSLFLIRQFFASFNKFAW